MIYHKTCFEVEVKTTSAMRDASHTTFDYDRSKGEYFDCEHGRVYVLADTVAEVEQLLGSAPIIAIRRMGVGYSKELQCSVGAGGGTR